ncbi:hypothetical protein M758_7G088100 [Ceratodon purpureus]|nr:hypothetical protein M758_7G088100 [Ceratodon purpureus]KAG0610745.1 hypothetical protein M758_7G088100 [Ceratodon purpureus]KAG0610746.1 hypothetical protein M758_7G088100 [Ceratodon purpureus]
MLSWRAQASTWLLGMFMVLSCCVPAGGTAATGVSEAYSHNDSSTRLYSSDNFLKCNFDQQVTVRTTQEISDLIKHYANHEAVRIRATRHGFHSSMGFVCAGKRGSSYAAYHNVNPDDDSVTSIMVLLHLMNNVVSVDSERHLLTVEAGMTIRELALAAEAHDLSVPAGALPAYANLTVGGVVSTSAHGTGYRTISTLGGLVTKVKWVNAKGEIIESEQGSKEMKALVGGLGLLGIVTELTLQLQPNSRTVVEVRKGLDDTNMVADVKKILQEETPHVMVIWRPDVGMYAATSWKQVEEGEYDAATMPKFYPNGTIALMVPVDEQAATSLKELITAWEDDPRDESPTADVLNAEVCTAGQAYVNSSLFTDGHGTLLDHATIPTNYAMVSADCAPKCSWDVHYSGIFTEDAEFAVKLSQFQEWVNDVKKIVRTELAEAEARLSKRYGQGKVKRCMAPGQFVLRFGQGNQDLLSTSTGSDDIVYLELNSVHSVFIPDGLSKQSSIVESIEQLTLCKYKGRPHWGKNHERVARHPKCKVVDNFPATNIAQLLELQQRHDPLKVFEPELFKQVLKKSGPDYSPLCTPHYWCYCATDEHCPAGYQCRPSPSFSEYKICRLI